MMMKKIFIILCITHSLLSCEENTINRDNNPCLQDKPVNVTLNLRLPQYADLTFSGTTEFISNEINYIKGIYVNNTGGIFTVFELAEPNDCEQICDVPTSLEDGYFVYNCDGEERKYDLSGKLVDGTNDDFDMRRYSTSYNEASEVLTIIN